MAELASSNATHWNPFPEGLPNGLSTNLTVNFCLAQKTNRTCHIGITPVIVWIVLAANLLKVICFFSTLFLVKGASEPLITTGDMIQSFILKPDPNLSPRCLVSKPQVKRDPRFWTAPKMPLQWLPKRRFWFRGASLSLWLSLSLPAIIGMASVIGLYTHNDLNSFLSLGFSSSSLSELVWWNFPWNLNHGLIGSVLLANTPQLISSYVYVAYNAILTSMLSHSELLRYGTKKRDLRVTQPTGQQRSSYYLSLPY